MRREQIERLYQQYGPALVAYGCSLTGRRATAEDLVQQVFLKLLRGAGVEPENPRGYLYRAVRNAALNAMRTAGREIELDPDNPWFAARAGSADGAANDALALQAVLLELPEEQREVIVMHVWGELTFEEIAAVAEISANTAASRYRYGLSKLRERMKCNEVNENAARK